MVFRKYRDQGLMVFCLPCGDFGTEYALNSQIKKVWEGEKRGKREGEKREKEGEKGGGGIILL